MVLLGTGTGSPTGKSVSSWTVAEGVGDGDLVRVRGTGSTTVESDPSVPSAIVAHLTCD